MKRVRVAGCPVWRLEQILLLPRGKEQEGYLRGRVGDCPVLLWTGQQGAEPEEGHPTEINLILEEGKGIHDGRKGYMKGQRHRNKLFMNGLCGKSKRLWGAEKSGSYSPYFSHPAR